MNITLGGIVGLIIGFACGGIICLLIGISWTDNHWRKKMETVWAKKDCDKAPYEIEKKE